MSRVATPTVILGDAHQYTLQKIGRKHNSTEVSHYQLRDLRSDTIIEFASEHRPKLEGSSLPPKKQRLKRYEPRTGSFGLVKKLTDKDGGALALKCFLEKPGEEYNKLRKLLPEIAHCYQAMGLRAFAFEHNNKLFLAMDWLGDQDLLCYMKNNRTAIYSNEQVLLALMRFLRRVHTFHSISGLPMVDFKPENMFPVIKDGVITDFYFADCDNAFSNPQSFTPSYLNDMDLKKAIRDPERFHSTDIGLDYRSLAIIAAIIFHSFVKREDLIIGAITRRSPIIRSVSTYIACGIRNDSVSPETRQAYKDYIDILEAGRNPLLEPSAALLKYQLRCDLGFLSSLMPKLSSSSMLAQHTVLHNPIYTMLKSSIVQMEAALSKAGRDMTQLFETRNMLIKTVQQFLTVNTKSTTKVNENMFIMIQPETTTAAPHTCNRH